MSDVPLYEESVDQHVVNSGPQNSMYVCTMLRKVYLFLSDSASELLVHSNFTVLPGICEVIYRPKC